MLMGRCGHHLVSVIAAHESEVVLLRPHAAAAAAAAFRQILNSLEDHDYSPPAEGRSSAPYDRSPKQPHRMPNAITQTGKAGSCMINWTSIWHTRPPNHTVRAAWWHPLTAFPFPLVSTAAAIAG